MYGSGRESSLFIWVKRFVVVQLLTIGISRFTSASVAPKGNTKFESLFVKIFGLKQKLSKILPATKEKIKFYLFKKTAACSFRL